MKPINPKHLNLLIFLVVVNLWSIELVAQPRVIANIPIGTQSPIISDSNQLITIYRDFDKEANFLNVTNILTGIQENYQISEEINVYEATFTKDGFFFIFRANSNSALVDTLCFFSYDTKKVIKLKPINFRKTLNDFQSTRILGVFDNILYCIGANSNNTFDVWKSNGTTEGTIKLYTLNTRSTQIGFVNGYCLLNVYDGENVSLISIVDNGIETPTILRSYSAERFSIFFANYDLKNGQFYLFVHDTLTNDYECISTKGTLNTTLSLFRSSSMSFSTNQSLQLKLNTLNSNEIVVRSLSTGEVIKQIPLPDEFKPINGGSIRSLGKGLFVTESSKYGMELAYLNLNDSFIKVDLSKGPFSGLTSNSAWNFSLNDIQYFNNEISDSFYLVGYGNNSKLKYLFKLILGVDSAKIFRLAKLIYLDTSRIDNVKSFVHKNKFYQVVQRREGSTNLTTSILFEVSADNEFGYVNDLPIDSGSTWHRQVGFGATLNNDPRYVLSDIIIDSEDNAILSFSVHNYGTITNTWNTRKFVFKDFQQYDTRYAKKINALNITFKISPMGNILWTSSFGNFNYGITNKLKQVSDKSDNIYVGGVAFRNAVFGIDTIKRQNAFLYLVKLDGKTGNIIHYKILAESQFTNDFDIDVLKTDAQNNLYISFHYKNFGLDFANSVISNNMVSPANALAKFDDSGNLLWIKNTLTPFTRHFGKTIDMCIDEENNKLYLIQTVGDYNWWSSCKFSNWDSYFQCLNFDGDIVWSKHIISDDLHSLRSIVLDNKGYINISGYFRGTIHFDGLKLTSKPISNFCNQFQYVTATINPNDYEVIMGATSDDWLFLPQKNISTGIENKNLSIGFEPANSRSYTLMTKELDNWGAIIGTYKIEKLGDPFDWEYYPSIASKNNFMVVADITYNQFDTFTNFMANAYNISIARYSLNNLFQPTYNQFPLNHQRSMGDEYDLILYPNPCSNKLNVFNQTDNGVLKFSIIQLDGKELYLPNPELINNTIVFDVSQLETGFYLLKVSGNKGLEVYKFFKK